jgi:hypothetical protein
MRCTCDADDVAHHHSFGGTYPCTGSGCKRCADHEEAVWRSPGERKRPNQTPRRTKPLSYDRPSAFNR